MPVLESHQYQQLNSSKGSEFDEFYQIYLDSIPLNERKSKTEISKLITAVDYRVLLILINNCVVGFSIVYNPADASFFLLEYMATHVKYRNKGLGSDLFQKTFSNLFSQENKICALIEIDSDKENSQDQQIRTRRLAFYRRLGCLRIDALDYLLPLKSRSQPPEMYLMIYCPQQCPPVRKKQLRDWLKLIYDRVYNCSPDDQRISKMMEHVADPIKIM